ncbi:hypothetical protein Bpla01_37550 [Burkholderia plantarii]|nr:hypothetical protein Bpla01_37550 [Burkholderia plantarii]
MIGHLRRVGNRQEDAGQHAGQHGTGADSRRADRVGQVTQRGMTGISGPAIARNPCHRAGELAGQGARQHRNQSGHVRAAENVSVLKHRSSGLLRISKRYESLDTDPAIDRGATREAGWA